MGNVPDWLWCLLAGEIVMLLAWLLIWSCSKVTVYKMDGLPQHPGPTQVDVDFFEKFPYEDNNR